MTNDEKIYLLNQYDNIDIFSEAQFLTLQEFSSDPEGIIRSMVASLLVHFENKAAKDILIELARDKDELVRTEAYDSLSIFIFADVEEFLVTAIRTESDSLARSYAILSWADVFSALREVL